MLCKEKYKANLRNISNNSLLQNGYNFVLENMKSCGNEAAVIKTWNTSFVLNKKCEIIADSCAEIFKHYKKATVFGFDNLLRKFENIFLS